MALSNTYFWVIIFLVWFIALLLVLPRTQKNRSVKGNVFVSALGYEKVREEAEGVGWRLNVKEFMMISLLAVGICVVISMFIKNFFFIIAGFFLSFYAPRYVVLKIKKKKRMDILKELPDNLKILTSKLMDFPQLQQALNASISDMNGQTKEMFELVKNGLDLGLKPEVVLFEMAQKVKVNKFYDYVEKLLMANTDGYTEQAIKSLKESIEAMSFDITEINALDIKKKKEKKDFIIIVACCWAMPVLVSGLNAENGNIFLDTWWGQLYIVSFFVSTIYAIVKGDDYLSLNLDEL